MPGEVTLRPTRPHWDGDFLLSLYASTRTAELAILGWPQQQLDAFVRMQFEAQSRGYAATFPGADSSVVMVEGMPAGRLIVDRSDDEIRIVDIALLPEFRRAGVGSALVRPLLEEAEALLGAIRACGPELRRRLRRDGAPVLDLATVTPSDFEPAVDSVFEVTIGEGAQLELRLTEVALLSEQPGARQPFALRFVGPPEPVLAQITHRLSHASLGQLELFLGPIQSASEGITYEAVFG
jgi:ribosomal protein S18 acetylase RimI-like enzyme